MTSLVDRKVLVIGGTSGIGAAIARLAASSGAIVTVASRSAAATQQDFKAQRLAVDIADRKSLEDLFDRAGDLHHICLAAGPPALTGRYADLDLAEAHTHLDLRFWAAFHVAQLACRHLAAEGSLTFIVGALSRKPIEGRAFTSGAQCAVEGLARALAVDLSPRRVNTVVAGLTDTPMWSGLPLQQRRSFFKDYAERVPARRVGEPQDVAALVLAAMTNPYITGASLVVDGGSTIN